MADILIKNVNHYLLGKKDILISQGKIKDIANEIHAFEAEVIDAQNLIAIPGLIDMQVHLREPGQSEKETIESGTKAAARGGFTTVACMPNTNPTLDSEDVLCTLEKKVEEVGQCKVLIIPAMTKKIAGDELTDYEMYKRKGYIGVTDDGRGVQSDSVMLEVFKSAAKNNLVCFQHCENESISKGAPVHLGVASEKLGVSGQKGMAESDMVRRDIELLEKTGGRYHVLHMSSHESLNFVRSAKEKNLNVTCEVTPHHLLLCDEDVKKEDANFKMNPPLRSSLDKRELNKAFISGEIDFITTDHAPHTPAQKALGIQEAPFGIVGLETAFPLLYTHYVESNKMNLERLVETMSLRPKKLFGIENGDGTVGSNADLCLFDKDSVKIVDENKFFSKSKNSPFIGEALKGWPVLTICEGEITYKDESYDF